MEIFLGIFILVLAIAGMSIGVIFNRKPLIGIMWRFIPTRYLLICGNDPNKCENESKINCLIP